jgi:hypothetical protein
MGTLKVKDQSTSIMRQPLLDIGTLSNLTTTVKTDLVSAINEVDSMLSNSITVQGDITATSNEDSTNIVCQNNGESIGFIVNAGGEKAIVADGQQALQIQSSIMYAEFPLECDNTFTVNGLSTLNSNTSINANLNVSGNITCPNLVTSIQNVIYPINCCVVSNYDPMTIYGIGTWNQINEIYTGYYIWQRTD